jgi:hypothetical protein
MPLKLKRRPKSPYWIIRGTLRGIRIEESTGTGDKRIAEEIRAKREAEILAESVCGRRATSTFAAAALSYLETGGSKRFTAPVISHFGTMPLGKIDQDAIDKAARKLYPRGGPATRDRQCYASRPRSCTTLQNVAGAPSRSSNVRNCQMVGSDGSQSRKSTAC